MTLGFIACDKDSNNEELHNGDEVKVSFVFTLDTSNGNLMSRSVTTCDEVFDEFYDKIKTGELVAENYSLTLTEVNTGIVYEFKGAWDSHNLVTMHTGDYKVVGTSTAIGNNIQEKCSFTFDEQIRISATSDVIMLHANYDCFLLIFNDAKIKTLTNFNGDETASFYSFNNYRYAFVNDLLYNENKKNDAYIIVKDLNDVESKIHTSELIFQKGKYYIYNSMSNGFDLPPMEDGLGNGTAEVETFVADDSTHPFYIGGIIHNNSINIVKRGLIVSINEDNLYYDENALCPSPYPFDYKDGYDIENFELKIIDCTNYGQEQFNIPLMFVYGNTKYYVRAFVQDNTGDYIYGNTIEIVTEDFVRESNKRDHANVWYDFYDTYTLFDLITDEFIDYANSGYYYSANEYPEDCYYETYMGYNTCYKFRTEWNHKLWYCHNTFHCDENKIVGVPVMEYTNDKLSIRKQDSDANKNIKIFYSVNENGRRPETFHQKYDTPIDINKNDIVYCYAISDDGYISYTNVYKNLK